MLLNSFKLLLATLLVSSTAYAQIILPPLTVQEKDGSPSVIPVFILQVSGDAVLIDEGNETVTISVDSTLAGSSIPDPAIVFSTGTVLSGDAAHLVWDRQELRQGIGLSSPESQLHLSNVLTAVKEITVDKVGDFSSAIDIRMRRARGSIGSESELSGSDNIGQWSWNAWFDSAGDYSGSALIRAVIVTAPREAELQFVTRGSAGSVQRMVIGDEGLVGIVVADPDAMLEINTNATTEEGLKIKGSASQSGALFLLTDSSDATFFSSGDGLTGSEVVWNEQGTDINFRVEGTGVTHALFIDGANGRIGVNTGTPGIAGIDVNGNVRVGDGQSTRYGDSSDGVILWNETDDVLNFQNIDSVSANIDYASTTFCIDCDNNQAETANQEIFEVGINGNDDSDANFVEKMALDEDGDLIIAGAYTGVNVTSGNDPGHTHTASGAPADAEYVVLTLDGDLSAERVLVAGDGLDLADGGANGNATLSTDLKANGGLVIESTELAVDLGASSITGTLVVGDGGTGATSLTDGGILLGSGSGAITALGVATNGQIPIGDGTTDPVLATITVVANETNISNGSGSIIIGIVDPLIVDKGGSGATTFTDGGLLLGSGTSAFTALGVATNGQIPIGDGTTDPQLATITGNDAIDITNGAASIAISLDMVTAGSDGDSTVSSSDSGLEIISGEVTIMRGCDDTEGLVWDETADEWDCGSVSGGSGEWTDTGDTLHPTDSSGTLDGVVIGGTTFALADITFSIDATTVFNEQSNDSDFRIESNGSTHGFFLQASDGHIGMGTSGPNGLLHLNGGMFIQDIVTFTQDDTTPDVSGGNIFLAGANTVGTALTDLDNPQVGQILTILISSDVMNIITITDGGNFTLAGNWTPDSIGDNLTLFVRADNTYWEVSRVDS